MRNMFTKSLAVSAVTGVALVGGAGMASAHSGYGYYGESSTSETTTQVQDNRISDSGNVSLDNILNDAVDVGDVAGGNNVLSGIGVGVTDNLDGILSGNNADVDANPDVDADSDVDSDVDADASSESTSVSDEDNEGLLDGLL